MKVNKLLKMVFCFMLIINILQFVVVAQPPNPKLDAYEMGKESGRLEGSEAGEKGSWKKYGEEAAEQQTTELGLEPYYWECPEPDIPEPDIPNK
jgi:hypothetical protein